MAANKFATMLHRNTNKLTLILIYAVLEWTLITLLLLNSLFSYLIIKFANYFGLKPPCLWCSRIDHFFEPNKKNKNSHVDLLCEFHSQEISKLGYCSNHQKLAKSEDMCENCFSSHLGFRDNSRDFRMKQIEGEVVVENGEGYLKCSCCGVSLNSKDYAPFYMIDPFWDVLEYTQKGSLITEAADDNLIEKHDIGSEDLRSDQFEDKQGFEKKMENQRFSDFTEGFGVKETEKTGENSEIILKEDPNSGLEIPSPHLEFFVDYSGHQLVPIELIDFETEEDQILLKADEEHEYGDYQQADVSSESVKEVEETEELLSDHQSTGELLSGIENSGELLSGFENSQELLSGVENSQELLSVHHNAGELLSVNENYVELLSVHQNSGESLSGNENSIELQYVRNENSVELRSVHQNSWESLSGNEDSIELLSGRNENSVELPSVHQTSLDLLSGDENSMELLSLHQKTQEFLPGNENFVELIPVHQNAGELLSRNENSEECKFLDSMEMEETEDSLVFHAKETGLTDNIRGNVAVEGEESDCDAVSVHEEKCQMPIAENEAEVSIGTEIPDLDSTDEIKDQDNFSSFTHEEPSTSSHNFHTYNGFEKAQGGETVELQNLSVQVSDHLRDIEEEKIPDTPSSLDSLNQFHKKLLLLERKESGAEESLDGSVISELEGGDAGTTAERLKSALKAERKALHALYAELEEERSASAVAANQTMAMINRLQEEKAAVQMEALQYQRMMEEQSEYDQEALQLLNELMVKREKEKQELERELEGCRKKVLEYEAKERMRSVRRSKDGSTKSVNSSASCSHSEDGDEMSIELNQDGKEEDGFDGNHDSQNHNTPVDAVLSLEESLADFEEERMSILEQLKVLEEKLFMLSDEEDRHFEDVRPIEEFYEVNGKHLNGNYDSDGQEIDGIANGFPKEMNGKHYQERRIGQGPKAKRLLPLFDAISTDSDDGLVVVSNGHENGFHSIKLENSAVTRFELEKKRIDIEEEVDQLYGRLQALEADREFLKHCIGSMKKGDKGMDLLQEILQHLRDLRNVELRVRSFGDNTPI